MKHATVQALAMQWKKTNWTADHNFDKVTKRIGTLWPICKASRQ